MKDGRLAPIGIHISYEGDEVQDIWNPTTDLNQLRECYLAAEKGDDQFAFRFYVKLSQILEQRIRDQISPIASMSNAWVKHPELVAQAILKAKGVS
jgi:hypothetical protein